MCPLSRNSILCFLFRIFICCQNIDTPPPLTSHTSAGQPGCLINRHIQMVYIKDNQINGKDTSPILSPSQLLTVLPHSSFNALSDTDRIFIIPIRKPVVMFWMPISRNVTAGITMRKPSPAQDRRNRWISRSSVNQSDKLTTISSTFPISLVYTFPSVSVA